MKIFEVEFNYFHFSVIILRAILEDRTDRVRHMFRSECKSIAKRQLSCCRSLM